MFIFTELISDYGYIIWSLNLHGTCGYYSYVINDGKTIVKAEENCDTMKGYICNCK